MGVDFFSSFDFSFGQKSGRATFLLFVGGMLTPLFMMGLGPYWDANCRESMLFRAATQGMLQIIEGSVLSRTGGAFQLMLSLWITLFSLTFASLLPFCHPLTQHLTVTGSLALPFWSATLTFCFNANWQSFLAPFMIADSYAASFLFQILEIVTIFIRSLTLCVRMTLSMIMSLLLYKIFVSLVLVGFSHHSLGGLILGFLCISFLGIYYISEWAVGFLQSVIFVGLLVSYCEESVVSTKDVLTLD